MAYKLSPILRRFVHNRQTAHTQALQSGLRNLEKQTNYTIQSISHDQSIAARKLGNIQESLRKSQEKSRRSQEESLKRTREIEKLERSWKRSLQTERALCSKDASSQHRDGRSGTKNSTKSTEEGELTDP